LATEQCDRRVEETVRTSRLFFRHDPIMSHSLPGTLEIRPSFRAETGRRVLRAHTALTVTSDRLVYRGTFRSREILRGRTPVRVVVAPVRLRSGRRFRLWLLLTGNDEAVLALNQEAWPSGGLDEVRQLLAVPLESGDAVLSPKQVRAMYRRALPWWAF
jgi:hypothetical protein